LLVMVRDGRALNIESKIKANMTMLVKFSQSALQELSSVEMSLKS